MIYNDNYWDINRNITDGSVGARKEQNIRDNIFAMNAISNSVINGHMPPIQISVTAVNYKCTL